MKWSKRLRDSYITRWCGRTNVTPKSNGDFQADASQGQARALFAALTQLGNSNNHPELATDGVVIYGFSAAGVLAATMSNEQPARLIGEVEYASGDLHVNLENVPITPAAAQIPTLLLANGADPKSGTYRSLDYFKRGRVLGAPWSYAVQHDTDHCCTLSTRSVLLPWLTAVASAQASGVHSAVSANATAYPNHTFSQFTCTPDDTTDAQEYTDCEFSAAEVAPTMPSSGVYGWLPDEASGAAWLTWVLNPKTN